MKGTPSEDGCSEFIVNTRYSELLILRDQIEKEIKEELAKDMFYKTFKSKPSLAQDFLNFQARSFTIKWSRILSSKEWLHSKLTSINSSNSSRKLSSTHMR